MSKGRIAIVTEDKFEDLELFAPKFRFEEAGWETVVLTPDGKSREGEHGYPVEAGGSLRDAQPGAFDALHIPGGTKNADTLRTKKEAVEFARRFWETGKPVFVICHGGWLLVEADVLEGAEMTSYPSIRKDCENAGATWRDEEVVVDGRLVSSRSPPDLPAFCREALRLLDGASAQARGKEAQRAR